VELRPQMLAVVPSELIHELQKSVLELDTDQTLLLIDKTAQYDESIARVLRKTAERLDYHYLLRILNEYMSQEKPHERQ